ncbi:MAG TPA: glycosyltransferase [Candidatus Didemnitutus sp.]|jgi:glycosyltransferase involved in cell wall biosynthesis
MIYYDVTKMAGADGRSGLTRVSSRLWHELGKSVRPVRWDKRSGGWRDNATGAGIEGTAADWLLTVELFSEAERPGWGGFLRRRTMRLAAVFHDAIPLRWPHITWPQSVQRHPEYIKSLAGFDRVWAVSAASLTDLTGFWRWQGTRPVATVSTVDLGSDFDGSERELALTGTGAGRPQLLSVGIVEPRKNQAFLLGVCQQLWNSGVDFELHVVGRENPHFGRPIARLLEKEQRRERRFHFHGAIGDEKLHGLYARASAVVFPTLAEGCGLPLFESLWRGVPCLASDLPPIRESAEGGGCRLFPVGDARAWAEGIRGFLDSPESRAELRHQAMHRPLPRWCDTAGTLLAGLRAGRSED